MNQLLKKKAILLFNVYVSQDREFSIDLFDKIYTMYQERKYSKYLSLIMLTMYPKGENVSGVDDREPKIYRFQRRS